MPIGISGLSWVKLAGAFLAEGFHFAGDSLVQILNLDLALDLSTVPALFPFFSVIGLIYP